MANSEIFTYNKQKFLVALKKVLSGFFKSLYKGTRFQKSKLEGVMHLFLSFFHQEPAKKGEFVEYFVYNMRKPLIIIL